MTQRGRLKRADGISRGAPAEIAADGDLDGLSPEMRKAIESIGREVLDEPIPERLLRAARRLARELHQKRTGT